MGNDPTKCFFRVPNSIYEKDLNAYELSVLGYILRCSNNRISAFPSYNTIAKRSGMSRRKAINIIDSLIKKGAIQRQIRRKSSNENCVNTYYVCTGFFADGGSAGGAPSGAFGTLNKERSSKELLNNDNGRLFNEESATSIENEIKNVIDYYYSVYRRKTGNNHPRLKWEQLNRVAGVIRDYRDSLQLDAEDTENFVTMMIDRHFERNIKTDYNVNHFASPEILDYLNNELFVWGIKEDQPN